MNYLNRSTIFSSFGKVQFCWSFIRTKKQLMSKNKKSGNKKPEAAAAAAAIVDNSDKAIFLNKSGEICLSIQAKPGSKDTSIADIQADAINVRIAAPPVDGEANKELIKYISKLVNLRQSDVSLDKGSKNRNKVLVLSNCKLSLDDIMTKFRSEMDNN